MVRQVNVRVEDADFPKLVRWKNRVSAAFGTELTWEELLLAYAGDPEIIPKRPPQEGTHAA